MGYDPLAELVKALARGSECAINPDAKPGGGGSARTLQNNRLRTMCIIRWVYFNAYLTADKMVVNFKSTKKLKF